MKRILFLALVLAGCGSGSQSPQQAQATINNYGLGWDFDVVGDTGTKVRYASPGVPSIAYVEALYKKVEQCVGATAPGPLVVFPDAVGTKSDSIFGETHLDTGTVSLESWLATMVDGRFDFPIDYNMAHEFVHWITHVNGMLTIEQQLAHDSPLFTKCTTL